MAARTTPEPTLAEQDPEIAALLKAENVRQHENLRLIASENYASRAVQEACSSSLSNKYSEGYAQKRYYQGQANVDAVEELAKARLAELYGAEHVNVQPYSGSPANLAVYLAFCKPGDPIVGFALPAGGHLTHGWKVSITGKYFDAHQYGVVEGSHEIDYDTAMALAKAHRPKVIFCGTTAYPRQVDYQRFRAIADEVGAILVADIAHVSGLVAGGVHPSPIGIADVVTSTTHKTLRGPRGGMILCKEEHAKKLDRAVFPGLQGGPHNATIAALAVAAKEALTPEFKAYAKDVVDNAVVLADTLAERGFDLVCGGTDTHLVLADLTPKDVPGKVAAEALEDAGIVCNYNSVPFDKRKPFDPSGIRLGTPAITSRGMGAAETKQVGTWIADVVENVSDEALIAKVKGQVKELCDAFPAPGLLLD